MKSKIYYSDTDETFDPNIAKGEICPKWMKKELYSEYNCIQRLNPYLKLQIKSKLLQFKKLFIHSEDKL